ncbi:MAG: hypothetical protein QOI15_1314 [Pseudonocardiales bacterium]|nr:hypothetical protein [Pseudonocardiales bacterium]MDT4920412.1 hypothetical protein [Pseudonocardiales bacterium]MDT4942455.1 hypothetical protein [Pseudonocardiales bacterium]
MADWTERGHKDDRTDDGGHHTRDDDLAHEHGHEHGHGRDDESGDTADAEPEGYRVEEYDDGANDDGADGGG